MQLFLRVGWLHLKLHSAWIRLWVSEQAFSILRKNYRLSFWNALTFRIKYYATDKMYNVLNNNVVPKHDLFFRLWIFYPKPSTCFTSRLHHYLITKCKIEINVCLLPLTCHISPPSKAWSGLPLGELSRKILHWSSQLCISIFYSAESGKVAGKN